jgi:hypothetical protein
MQEKLSFIQKWLKKREIDRGIDRDIEARIAANEQKIREQAQEQSANNQQGSATTAESPESVIDGQIAELESRLTSTEFQAHAEKIKRVERIEERIKDLEAYVAYLNHEKSNPNDRTIREKRMSIANQLFGKSYVDADIAYQQTNDAHTEKKKLEEEIAGFIEYQEVLTRLSSLRDQKSQLKKNK